MSENTQDTQSEVEKLYAALVAKFGGTRNYHELHPTEQMNLVAAINIILQIVRS